MKKGYLKAIAILTLVPVMLFSACIEKKDNKNSDADTDQSLQKILDNGELVLGLDASFPPMGFKDKNNNITGFDIDVATEVCKRMDIKLKCQPIDWDTKETELSSGNIDCIWNGLSVDDKRKETFSLSDSYMKNQMIFAVRSDSGITTIDQLKDKKVAVQNGSTAQTILKESGKIADKDTVVLADNPAALVELENKTVQSVFLDKVVADYYITTQKKDFKLLEESLFDEEYAIAFRKNDKALTEKVNEVLKEMKSDGKLSEISTKWFGKDVTIIK